MEVTVTPKLRGMMLKEWKGTNRREKIRHEFPLVTLYFIGRENAHGSLLDISQVGAKINMNFQPEVDETLKLIIGSGQNKLSAKVVWTKILSKNPIIYNAGISFNIPFLNFSELFHEIRSSHYGAIDKFEHTIARLKHENQELCRKIEKLEEKLKKRQSWWHKIRNKS
jgi:hypothetical protein